MKKLVCAFLAIVMCVSMLAGCGGSTTTTETAAPNVAQEDIGTTNTGSSSTADSIAEAPPEEAEYYDDLSLVIGDKVAVIDPFNTGFCNSQAGLVSHMIYDTLVYYTIANEYEPDLATEWTASDDALSYTFKLREGVKFHNGEEFTADDVAFTIDKAKEATGTYINSQFAQVDSYEVVNDYEITLNLVKPNYDFIYDVSNPYSGIMNREAYESGNENAGWIGTGPFTVDTMVANDSIVFARYDDYFGEAALCKTFTMKYIAEEEARMIMFDNDEVTFVNLSNVKIPEYEAYDWCEINSYVMNNCNYVAFNTRKEITGDLNFRMACAYAIDRQTIVDIALNGYGQICDCGSFWGNNSAYKNRDIPRIEQDLDKAKEYLAQSSYNGEEILIWAGMAATIKAATVVCEQLSSIGINAKVQETDGAGLTAATAYDTNDCDIVVNSGVWTPLAGVCRNFLVPGSGSNKAVYDNAEVTALIEQAAAMPDGEERQEIYYKIQELVAADMPYIGTYHMALYVGAQKGAGGCIFFPTNNHDYSHAYRIKTAE